MCRSCANVNRRRGQLVPRKHGKQIVPARRSSVARVGARFCLGWWPQGSLSDSPQSPSLAKPSAISQVEGCGTDGPHWWSIDSWVSTQRNADGALRPRCYFACRRPQSSLSGRSLQLRAPIQEGLAFRWKGSIGVNSRRRASARDPTAPSALTDPGLVLVRPGSPGPLGRGRVGR